jgi:hypothetical protein
MNRNLKFSGFEWCLTPEILATWEAEIGMITVHPKKNPFRQFSLGEKV